MAEGGVKILLRAIEELGVDTWHAALLGAQDRQTPMAEGQYKDTSGSHESAGCVYW